MLTGSGCSRIVPTVSDIQVLRPQALAERVLLNPEVDPPPQHDGPQTIPLSNLHCFSRVEQFGSSSGS
ncbi:hypothetical protein CHELA1G11_13005 [Hyphomicrobiales bacterium]|nr:hypothetical protein CHELA1G2_11305 [Hyphomicrobiales bacterium]CAH1668640.1 hypothetical protein CHELA1G11_13005 [Hyphomicrobiales bacterium]